MSEPMGEFVLGMAPVVRQAGAIAVLLQDRVTNERKVDLTRLPNDDDLLRERRAAKTLADEIVQELLLVAAFDVLDVDSTLLDAEEETPLKRSFIAQGADRTLVIDPIDGTLEYLAGESSYSICVGLVADHRLDAALVYFPSRDQLYLLDQQERSYVAPNALQCGLHNATALTATEAATQVVFVNGRVPENIQKRLRSKGYEVIDDTVDGRGAPDCILACLDGEALAYVAHTRQMRDILLGGVLAGAAGGFAVDWHGKQLSWPKNGRVDRAVFGTGTPSRALLECLRE
jgi:fructose-1,6-bisphosphatase/inositol monophosphatase family enzyme